MIKFRVPSARTLLTLVAVTAVIVALFVAGARLGAYVVDFAARVEAMGARGPLVFIIGYALATVAFVPGSMLTLAAGALFGLFAGVAWVFTGAVVGSSAAFLIGRYLARPTVERKVSADVRFAAIDRAIAREGRKIVLLLRLSPVFPYNLLNYGLGVTGVRFGDYLLASIGMLPGTVMYVYIGRLVGDVATLAAGAEVPRGAGYYALLTIGFLATVTLTWYITRLARRALAEAARLTDDSAPLDHPLIGEGER